MKEIISRKAENYLPSPDVKRPLIAQQVNLTAKLYNFEVDMDHVGPLPRLSLIVGEKEYFLEAPSYDDLLENQVILDFFSRAKRAGLISLQMEKISPDDFKSRFKSRASDDFQPTSKPSCDCCSED